MVGQLCFSFLANAVLPIVTRIPIYDRGLYVWGDSEPRIRPRQ